MTNHKKNIYLIQGSEDKIKKFFEAIKVFGEVKDINIQKLEYKEGDILSYLTEDQRKILSYAKKYGYYDYPRKITSKELSEKIGVNVDTTIEVLRKAEKYIISRILD